jgi:hypothetical protein
VTFSPNFPTTPDAFDPTFNGGGASCVPPPFPPATCDAFVSRLDTAQANAASLEYSTFLGGNGTDLGRGIQVLGNHAMVGGATNSSDFPVTPNAFDTTRNDPGFGDAFVTRLEAR